MYLEVCGLSLYENTTKNNNKKKEMVLETRKICTFITLKIYKLCLMKSRLSDIESNTMCLEKLNRMSSMEGWYPTILI